MTTTLTTSEYDYCVFDELGKPMTFTSWLAYSSEDRYKRESRTKGFTIITQWTGIDMPEPERLTSNFSFSRWNPNKIPMIYEGVVYDQDMLPIHRARYSSREKAYESHSLLLKAYSEDKE
jgi:hypothetical protein